MTARRPPIRHVVAALVLLGGWACGRTSGPPPGTLAPAAPAERPALVVMLVVDQLGEPLLERYEDLYRGGFRRLLDEGRHYVGATHDFAATKTAPGHATLATGVYPSRHGVVANEWFEEAEGRWVEVENVEDPSESVVGHPGLTGASPHRLMRPGLADWLRDAEPGSRIASVSAKDRGAVLPVGHVRGQVWWFEDTVGRFVTSTYYRDRNPGWVDEFHAAHRPEWADDTVWSSTLPVAARTRSRPDTAAYEGDGVHIYFPHRYRDEGSPGAFWEWFADTPMLDAATLDFAETLVDELDLGRDSVPDFLNVSVSQVDRVGHDYGPWSREQLDNLLRLDRRLGEFFDFLDARVGRGRWVLGLSADHGVLVSPEDLRASGDGGARRLTTRELALLDSLAGASAPEDHDSLAAYLRGLDFVADAWTWEELQAGVSADSFAVLARNSLYPGRAGGELGGRGVEIRLAPELIEDERGTGHGSPYWYDRHVPMIFLGLGIPPGRDPRRVSTVDFAPTLARLLGIPYPHDLDGSPLAEVIGGS